MKYLYAAFVVTDWLAGVVLAKGFWSTCVAIVFMPWAWYLLVERALQAAGWVS